jgi:hypothetical protein
MLSFAILGKHINRCTAKIAIGKQPLELTPTDTPIDGRIQGYAGYLMDVILF